MTEQKKSSLGGLLAYKVGMTQLFVNGVSVPVTLLHAEENIVSGIRTKEKNGYSAVQVATRIQKSNRMNKPHKGLFAKIQTEPRSILREFRVENPDVAVGDKIGVDAFKIGDKVVVTGISKGKGFQGVMKRHGFHGGPASHGSRFHRTTGSVGNRAWPARVYMGRKMPGHMGHERVSVGRLQVLDVDAQKGYLVVKGAVPGPTKSLVEVRKTVTV